MLRCTPHRYLFLKNLIWGTLLVLGTTLSGMDNADVIAMSDAGIDDETIIVAIRNSDEKSFSTDADSLIELKKAGVSDEVLRFMINPTASKKTVASSDEPQAMSSFQVLEDESSIIPPPATLTPGETYYTRFTLHFETSSWRSSSWPATNYARGELLPINSPVRLISLSGSNVKLFLVDENVEMNFENIEKYTDTDLNGFAQLLISAEPTRIEEYGDEIAGFIERGELRLGMTKQQVILTRGYPPTHKTASLEKSRWIYWSSRFVQHTLAFDGDILSEARGVD